MIDEMWGSNLRYTDIRVLISDGDAGLQNLMSGSITASICFNIYIYA